MVCLASAYGALERTSVQMLVDPSRSTVRKEMREGMLQQPGISIMSDDHQDELNPSLAKI